MPHPRIHCWLLQQHSMADNTWLLSVILLAVTWKIEGTTREDCLVCWDTLCESASVPSNIDDICTSQCVDFIPNYNPGSIAANTEACCAHAATYLTNINGSFLSASSNEEQCQSSEYNSLPNDFLIDDYDASFVAQKQYFLFNTVQFNCSGCINAISIYSQQAVVNKETSVIQIWSRKEDPVDNKTVLTLKNEKFLELDSSDSMEQMLNFYRTSKEVNESFCFEASDVFGITITSSFGVFTRKNSNNSKIYSRDSQSCDSLRGVYYLDNDDLVGHGPPLIAVNVTQIPVSSSVMPSITTVSTQILPSTPLNTNSTSSSSSTDTVTTASITSSVSVMTTNSINTLVTTSSISSTSIPSTTSASGLIFGSTIILAIVIASVVIIVTLLVIVAIIVFMCVYFKNKNISDSRNGIEMVGHFGRYSRDSLDFQVATRVDHASVNTSQLSTPTPPPYMRQGYRPNDNSRDSIPTNYYDDPTVLDTTQLGSQDHLARNNHDSQYTTMSSVIMRNTTPITTSRSTISDNSSTRHGPPQIPHYDVPKPNSEYDEPTALVKQYGTLDPYQNQDFEKSHNHQGGGNNRQYFVLDQDNFTSIQRASHLPIYHVLEQGYHVPSAIERNSSNQQSFNTERLAQQPFFEEQPNYWEPAEQTECIYDQLNEKKCRELKRADISFNEEIGRGQFGAVCSGVWLLHGGGRKNVAVKVCKTNAKEEEKARLLREGARMMQFFHTHVVHLYGIVTVGEPLLLVIELMKEGDLKEYLKNNIPPKKPLTPQQLLKFCKDIATGMRHLAKKEFVHRDLAARNIMLDEKLVCKIGDFGMTRSSTHKFDMSKPEQVPLRWTAPEALKLKQYSEKSDVYSYGMVLYEIWSLGKNPFALEENNQIIIDFIAQGRLLAPPPGCPREIYRLMAQCWHPNPKDRPSFTDICSDFLDIDSESLLQWSSEDCEGLSEKAMELGADIPHGYQLYKDLQHQYRTNDYT